MNEILKFIDQICSLVPGRTGWFLRRVLYRWRISMGKGVIIEELVCLKYPERMGIGSNSYIGRGTMIQGSGYVEIGKNVLIGPWVKIWSSSHNFDDVEIPIFRQGHTYGKVIIGDDVWIGTGAVILKGVTIGRGAVVGAAAVVIKDVPQMTVVVGNPARPVRKRGAR